MFRYRSPVLMVGASLASVISSLLVIGVLEWQERSIDQDATSIATNAAPSVQHLSAARAEFEGLTLAAHYLLDGRGSEGAVGAARGRIAAEVQAYLARPPYPGESELWTNVSRRILLVERATDDFLAAIHRKDLAGAREIFDARLTPAIEDARTAMSASIELNANEAKSEASRVLWVREHAKRFALAMEIVFVFFTVLALWITWKTVQRELDLLARNRDVQERRAQEFELFAQQVAHDILGPLTPLNILISFLRSKREVSEKTVDRAEGGLKRSRQLVNDLLEFARAGAKPSPNDVAEVDSVLHAFFMGLEPEAAEANANVKCASVPGVYVACKPGVLHSLVANLVRNGMKYLNGSEKREITVEISPGASMVHFDVRDTGPGIPAGLLTDIFEPYVRTPAVEGKPGLGLGLATVKRLAEAHHGRVGLKSTMGEGCRFWFELPRAEAPTARTDASREPPPRGDVVQPSHPESGPH